MPMRTPDSMPAPELLDLLTNPDKDVRQGAAIALGELADDRTAETVARRLWDEPDFYVRETLTWTLTQVAAAARPAVVDALSDHRPEARTQALHVLSKIADPEVVPEGALGPVEDRRPPSRARARPTARPRQPRDR